MALESLHLFINMFVGCRGDAAESRADVGPHAPPRSRGDPQAPLRSEGWGGHSRSRCGGGGDPPENRDSMLKVTHKDQEDVLGAVGGGAVVSCSWAAEMRSPSVALG